MKQLFVFCLFIMSGLVLAGPPPGHPSNHPSVGEAAQALSLSENDGVVNLPYEGKVLQAIPSNAYVFIEVETSIGVIWLSAPLTDLNKGDVVRYDRGTVMTDFYSKKQQITFPKIMFVGRVVKVD